MIETKKKVVKPTGPKESTSIPTNLCLGTPSHSRTLHAACHIPRAVHGTLKEMGSMNDKYAGGLMPIIGRVFAKEKQGKAQEAFKR